jgi:hypothetical protein
MNRTAEQDRIEQDSQVKTARTELKEQDGQNLKNRMGMTAKTVTRKR